MTTKTFKVLFFAVLIAAITIPVSGIVIATGQEQVTKQKLQIDIPEDSPAKVSLEERAHQLISDKSDLYQEDSILKAKYDAEGLTALTDQEIQRLNEITEQLRDINKKIDQRNAEARALITMTEDEKAELTDRVHTSKI